MREIMLIVDFGSQYTNLIARRMRELGVEPVVVGWNNAVWAALQHYEPKGIILSGGPDSIYEPDSPSLDRAVLPSGIPVLGICYGMHLMVDALGGEVQAGEIGEYGSAEILVHSESPLLKGLRIQQQVWASHGDSVSQLPEGFRTTATGPEGQFSAIENVDRQLFAVQFHPEVDHTPHGRTILRNFALSICGFEGSWSWGDYLQLREGEIRRLVWGDQKALVLVSGGVDSTVAAVLADRALGERAYLLHVDNGLMRKDESAQVLRTLEQLEVRNLVGIDAGEEFLAALKGVTDPEKKRQIIGNVFVEVLERKMTDLGLSPDTSYLIQGTLYTDLVESGQGGTNKATIKSHHNASAELIVKWRESGRLLEPNDRIYKDEVRTFARALGIPEAIASRQPYPGPGLAIRILGEVNHESVAIARQVDDIFISELEAAGIYGEISQALAVFKPVVRTTGVQGDARTYGHEVTLRAVVTNDFMTVKFAELPWEVLRRISTRITNELKGVVNRVTYDITDKPPATTEWE